MSPAVGLRHTKRALFAYWEAQLCAILVSYRPLGRRFHSRRVPVLQGPYSRCEISGTPHLSSRRCSAPCSLPAALLYQKPCCSSDAGARDSARARDAIAAPLDIRHRRARRQTEGTQLLSRADERQRALGANLPQDVTDAQDMYVAALAAAKKEEPVRDTP